MIPARPSIQSIVGDLWTVSVGVVGTLAGVLAAGMLSHFSERRRSRDERAVHLSDVRDERIVTFVESLLEYSSAEAARWYLRAGSGPASAERARDARRKARQAYFSLRLVVPHDELGELGNLLTAIDGIKRATVADEVATIGETVRDNVESAVDRFQRERGK